MRVERLRVFHPSGGPVLVKRAEQDSTDVNLIMDSWVHTGAAVAGHMNPGKGRYGDFSSGVEYHSALSAVREAEGMFLTLPPKVRNHVDNDPGKLLDLFFDPERREECERLGLVDPKDPGVAPRPGERVVERVLNDKEEKAKADSEGSAAGASSPAAELFD